MSADDGAKEKTFLILQELLSGYSPEEFAVRLWDGSVWPKEVKIWAALHFGAESPWCAATHVYPFFGGAGCESLREHFAPTLRHWVHRLETHYVEALQYVDEVTYRAWRLFMSGSADGFEAGRHNVYQSLLVMPGSGGRSGLPLTRIVHMRSGRTGCRSDGSRRTMDDAWVGLLREGQE